MRTGCPCHTFYINRLTVHLILGLFQFHGCVFCYRICSWSVANNRLLILSAADRNTWLLCSQCHLISHIHHVWTWLWYIVNFHIKGLAASKLEIISHLNYRSRLLFSCYSMLKKFMKFALRKHKAIETSHSQCPRLPKSLSNSIQNRPIPIFKRCKYCHIRTASLNFT